MSPTVARVKNKGTILPIVRLHAYVVHRVLVPVHQISSDTISIRRGSLSLLIATALPTLRNHPPFANFVQNLRSSSNIPII